MLERKGVEHEVLNAKQHEREAEIVAEAGQPRRVTIATNMAGRGTDIKLGPGVADAAACTSSAPSGTNRAGSTISCAAAPAARAIPARRRFYVSLEDELMRRFGSERIVGLMERLGMEEDVPIEHRRHLQVDRERPDQSRRPQLRYPQARRPVRRRDEPAPRSDLRRPPADRQGRGHERADRGDDRSARSKTSSTRQLGREVARDRRQAIVEGYNASDSECERHARGHRGTRRGGIDRGPDRRARCAHTRKSRIGSVRRSCAKSSATSCSP